MEDYKQDIRESRKGSLGSSDGKLLRRIAELGYVPKSEEKRLAVCKGLIPQQDIPQNSAMRAGDYIEMQIFENLKQNNPLCESNPLVVSKKYCKKNVKLIDHPDIRIVNEAKKTVTYIEIKATKHSFDATRSEYEEQLFIHTIMSTEEAKERGREWKSQVILAHYLTDGLDLDNGIEFDPGRLLVKPVRISRSLFDMERSLTIIDSFLESFDEYYDGDIVDGNLLPEPVREQMQLMANILTEIKERENQLNDFKEKLFVFMSEHDVKSIKNELFSFVRVDATESKSFDTKRYLEDMRAKHPRVAAKVEAAYTKTSKKKGYVKIDVKKQ